MEIKGRKRGGGGRDGGGSVWGGGGEAPSDGARVRCVMGKQNQEIGWNRGGRVGGIQIQGRSSDHTDDLSCPEPQVLSD